MSEILDIKNNNNIDNNLLSEEESRRDHSKPIASKTYKWELVWKNIILMIMLHTAGIYGFYHAIENAKWQTSFFVFFISIVSSMGVQVGAHRLWSHKAFKARLPLQILLAFLQTMSLQNDIYEWSRDHRVHHKYSETDADPHNSKRGFFFSHVGWLLIKKHPDVIAKGNTIDMSDLLNDPLIQFQRKYYIPLVLIIWGLIPTYIPHLLWNESLWASFFGCVMFRYALTLNLTWCVNSVAHMWGNKPYDQHIDPVEASMRHLMLGEGFHNYHHSFPWDYSTSEFGALDVFNPATAFIDFFARIGLAYDLKTTSNEKIKNRRKRTGDLSYNDKKTPLREWAMGTIVVTAPVWIFFVVRLIVSFVK